ncbi:hypothetical protein pb186bvf_001305 [Paramecium bursaria]
MIYDIEGESDDDQTNQLKVPQFPAKKRPSLIVAQSSKVDDMMKNLQEYKSMPDSLIRKELENKIVKQLIVEKCSETFALQALWAIKYSVYLYENGEKPGPIDNSAQPLEFIVVNGHLWKFLREEYGGGPEIQQKHKNRSNSLALPAKMISQSEFQVPLVGFQNEQNYCYLHSAIQSLLSIAEFNYYFLRQIKNIQFDMPFCKAYLEVFNQAKICKTTLDLPILKQLTLNKFPPKSQHDCQEYLLHVLGSMEDELNNLNRTLKPKGIIYTNFIENLYKGKIQTTIHCLECQQTNHKLENFITLSLAISYSKTLEQCLEDFTKEEPLKDYNCKRCNGICTRKIRLYEMPKFLILHLKRFQYFPQIHKSNKTITFPLDSLQVTNKTYRLKSVIVHKGQMQQGHYMNFSKRFHNWYKFNDSIVRESSKKEVQLQQAYILIYQWNDM